MRSARRRRPPPPRTSGREHPIEFALPAELPLVRADAAQLERVFSNLIENAIKFSPAEAPVQDHRRRRRRAGDRPRDRPGQRDPAPLSLAGVRAVLPRPRRPSPAPAGRGWGWRSAAGSSRPTAGRSSSRPARAAGRLHGELPVAVQPDRRRRERNRAARRRRVRARPPPRVLVVDDEPQIVRGLKILLRNAGYTVEAAETKAEALVELGLASAGCARARPGAPRRPRG